MGGAATGADSGGGPPFRWPLAASSSDGAGAGAGAAVDGSLCSAMATAAGGGGGGQGQVQPLVEITQDITDTVHFLARDIEILKRENMLLAASVVRNQVEEDAGYSTVESSAAGLTSAASATSNAQAKKPKAAAKDRGKEKEKDRRGKGKSKFMKETERVRDMRNFDDIKDKKNKPKKPFCNACRRLVMDRVNVFLVFHPHPGTNASTNKLFETTVRNQYQKDRYKSRKMSVEYCMCCRTPELAPRLAIDRFGALWHNDAIQLRLATQWYKEVRRIDIDLCKQFEKLQACAGLAAGHSQVREIIKAMRGLEQQRSSLKPIQKASARITEKSDGPQFYAEGIKQMLAACAESARTAPISASILKQLRSAGTQWFVHTPPLIPPLIHLPLLFCSLTRTLTTISINL